jgi:purine nucleosidase/pyrimidine-specific ribonucleoside hydrolase
MQEPGNPMKKILIDTDPGLDDAVAIMAAIGSGRLDVQAITTVSGNLTADRCSINARKVLELIGAPPIPVARGMQTPLVRPYPRDPFSHGDDGLANLGLPAPSLAEDTRFAPDLIVELVNRQPGEIGIVALGPLTNLALAVMRDPDLPKKVSELTLIGGAYGFNSAGSLRATGDNPASEWNIYVDPEAARIVFEAGFRLTAIGLDVATHERIDLSAADRARLASSSSKAAWFLRGAVGFVESRGFRSYCALIDSLAVAAVLDPAIIRTETVHVAIETKGEFTLGQTVVDRREHFRWTHLPRIAAAAEVDSARFFQVLLDALGA